MRKSASFILLLSLLFCAARPVWAQAESRNSLEAKLALENSLEKRLKMVLSEALGTEDVIVIISAELQEQEKKTALEIMPGIPKEEKMGDLSLSSTLTMLKKLSASLILDKNISDDDTKLARKLTAGLLGLPPEREDLITIEKMNFRKTRPFSAGDLLVPPNVWNLAWIILVAALVATALAMFLSPLSRSARAFVEAFSARNAQSEGQRPEERHETEAAETKTAASPGAAQQDKKPLFGFLSVENIQNLIFLMKTRTTQDLTIVLNYAPKDVSAKLVEALYPRSVEALASLPKVTLMPEKNIRALEAEIQAALDYVVGGEDKTLGIVETLDETTQEKALTDFKRLNPLFSIKAKASVVRLADLVRLEPLHVQTLARRLPMRVIAAALKGSAYAEDFISKLSSGMQERLRQELELTRALPAEAYKAERYKLTDALRQLIKEGLVSLGAETAGAAPAPEQAPAQKAPAASAAAPAPREQPTPAKAVPPAAPAAMPKPVPAPTPAGPAPGSPPTAILPPPAAKKP